MSAEDKPLFPTIDVSQFVGFKWSDDAAKLKSEVEEKWFTPYKVELPGYVLMALKKLSLGQIGINEAENVAYTAYLAYRSKGIIKLKSDEPMPDDVKAHLRELNNLKREQKKLTSAVKKIILKTPKIKLPVYSDHVKQSELVSKYKWAQPGSFKQDPNNSNMTLVDIKCMKCGASRTIHLAELFQVKLCTFCKDKNGKKSKHGGKRNS